MPVAAPGNWNGEYELESISKRVFLNDWNLIHSVRFPRIPSKYKMYRFRNSAIYIIGSLEEEESPFPMKKEEDQIAERFKPIFKIRLSKVNIGSKMGYNKLYRVDGVILESNLHGKDIATTVYRYLVNHMKYNIMSDSDQYYGARVLWSKISKGSDIKIDKIDISYGHEVILQKDIVLKHGSSERDIDESFWSWNKDRSKENIRGVMTKISSYKAVTS